MPLWDCENSPPLHRYEDLNPGYAAPGKNKQKHPSSDPSKFADQVQGFVWKWMDFPRFAILIGIAILLF